MKTVKILFATFLAYTLVQLYVNLKDLIGDEKNEIKQNIWYDSNLWIPIFYGVIPFSISAQDDAGKSTKNGERKEDGEFSTAKISTIKNERHPFRRSEEQPKSEMLFKEKEFSVSMFSNNYNSSRSNKSYQLR
jgi:hypothetical protein